MRTHSSIAAVLLAGLTLTGCQQQHSHRDLQGTWTTHAQTMNSRGKNLTGKTLVIEIDSDGMINGTSGWALVDGEGGFAEDRPVKGDTEEIVGAFDEQSGMFYLVETEENGFLHGHLIDEDEILVFLVQPGEKHAVSTMRLSRED